MGREREAVSQILDVNIPSEREAVSQILDVNIPSEREAVSQFLDVNFPSEREAVSQFLDVNIPSEREAVSQFLDVNIPSEREAVSQFLGVNIPSEREAVRQFLDVNDPSSRAQGHLGKRGRTRQKRGVGWRGVRREGCNNKILLLWVKIPILTFLDFGGRVDKSSTVTTRHITASQNWIENKPKTLLWHSESKNQ